MGLGRVHLGFMTPESQPAWNKAKTLCVLMEGELYNTAALKQSLADGGQRCEKHTGAELVLRLYEEFGESFAVKLNGAFAVAIWDGRARKLLLVNDRLGLFPTYYARVNDDFIFASGVRALLAEPALSRSVDAVGVTQFVVHDHLLDDRTLLSAARLLPQASILTFHQNQLQIRPYWTLRYPEHYNERPEADYVEQFVHYLRQAVGRQQPNNKPAGVLLSGGLDSRILLALLGDGIAGDLHTFTFGIPGCDDALIAREVAAKVGTRHHFFELKSDWLLKLAGEAVRVTDGLGNIVNLHVLATLRNEAQHAQVMYKGFMGDALLGFALKRQMWADYDSGTRYRIHRGVHTQQGVINYDRVEQGKLFTEAFQKEVGDALFQTYRDGMDRAGVSQLANQRLYFDLTQRVPRMTIKGVEAARSQAIVRLPFCDNDLLDFVLTVPPGFLFERYLVKEAIIRNYPQLAQIPVAGYGRPLTSCARDILIQSKHLLSWHLKNLGLGWMNGSRRHPYKDYDNWFRNGLRKWVEDVVLSPSALERGYFRPDYVRQLVAEHMAGTNHSVRLGGLVTLELWHRQFLN
jgi:asparagine synthase (glutamine-hydrolysing)